MQETRARQDATEALIELAASPAGPAPGPLDEFGPERAAEAVLAELLDRAALIEGPPWPATVQLDLGAGPRRLGYRLVTGAGQVDVRPGWAQDPLVVFRQDLAELVLAVFGPPGRHASTRELLTWEPPGPPGPGPDDPVAYRLALAVGAAHQLTAALSQERDDLTRLAVRLGSDKWGSHWYTPHYERYFGPFRQDPVRLLEIGIGGYHDPDQGGASLRMWKHFFRRGLVHGLDVYDKNGLDEPRVRTHRGDQGDPDYLAGLAAEIGPLDIVIDDGSHFNDDVVTSFRALFPHLRPGGLYVIEDVQTAYWPGWGGQDGPQPSSPATSLGLVKTLIDGLHHQERPGPGEPAPSDTDRTVTAVHVHHNLVVVEKGLNTEQGAPAWIPRYEDPRRTLLAKEGS